MSDAILRADAVSKEFVLARNLLGRPTRVLRAVRGVSLSIERGATLALVGESGSGKSTLGRCIAGLLRPTSGSVELAGHDVQRLSGAALLAFRRQVQTIFQDPYSSLNPRRTVGDAIMDGMVIHKLCGAEERQARMLALLSRVGLQPDHARRYPHQFSGGQRQRIAIARALALEPRFIVADEAVSALDVSVKAQVLDLLADLQAEHGLTYLFISHDLGVVRHFADRVAVMAAGEIVEEGDCDQIFESPAQAYTRQLIAAVPRPDPARRSLRRGDAARAGAVFPAGRGWGPAKRGVKKGRDRRRGLKFWFRPAVSRREASGGGSWQPWPLACRNCRHDYDFLGLPADGHRAPDAVAGAVARENGQPAGRSAAAVHHGDAGWQAGASDLYPRQHRGDGAVRRHLAARSQRRDLRDDGDQWPQFSQQPFQWAGRRRAEPLPHGRRQLLAILILPSAATEGVSASALSSQLRGAPGTGVSLRIMTASGTQVDVKLGASADGIAVDIGVSEGELSEDERLAIAGLAKSFQDAVDGLGSVPPRLAVAGLAKFDSAAGLGVAGNRHRHPRFGHGLDQLPGRRRAAFLTIKNATGVVTVNVDASQPTVVGSAQQRDAAVASYLQKFDAARSRGEGDQTLMSFFKEAFSALHQSYETAAPSPLSLIGKSKDAVLWRIAARCRAWRTSRPRSRRARWRAIPTGRASRTVSPSWPRNAPASAVCRAWA